MYYNDIRVYTTDESCFVENLLPPDGRGGLALVREIYLRGRVCKKDSWKQRDKRDMGTRRVRARPERLTRRTCVCGSVAGTQGARQINRQIEPLSIKRSAGGKGRKIK